MPSNSKFVTRTALVAAGLLALATPAVAQEVTPARVEARTGMRPPPTP